MVENKDIRQSEIKNWLTPLFTEELIDIQPISGDASFRRYFRLKFGEQSFIIMDAPPEANNNDKFIRNTKLFEAVSVPQIIYKDEENGFFVLEDLGDETLFINWNKENQIEKYQKAIIQLIEFQKLSQPGKVTNYSEEILNLELSYFKDWYRDKYLGKPLSDHEAASWSRLCQRIVSSNLGQTNVYVHRDFHSKNLMLQHGEVRIIDHQDALYGPITYDLASLLKDAYIVLTEEQRQQLTDFYYENSYYSLPNREKFTEDLDLMGLQRHIKILGIFARLNLRDGKKEYLQYIPLIKKYIQETSEKYDWLKPLIDLIDV